MAFPGAFWSKPSVTRLSSADIDNYVLDCFTSIWKFVKCAFGSFSCVQLQIINIYM